MGLDDGRFGCVYQEAFAFTLCCEHSDTTMTGYSAAEINFKDMIMWLCDISMVTARSVDLAE